jgi:conjugal transfer/entry exclusion protein
MSETSAIDKIRDSRDTALAALNSSVTAVRKQIQQTTAPNQEQANRLQNLTTVRTDIRAAATEAVLALPEVIAAAAKLNTLATDMKTVAQALPNASKVMTTTATILAFGQQFLDLFPLPNQG